MKRILIIQTGKLGDMVCTTPVFRAIKNNIPNSFLIVAGDKVNKEILNGNKYVDEYILSSEIDTNKVKSLKLDVSILLTPNPRILKSLILGRVRKIIVPRVVGGYSPYATKIYRFLSLFVTKVPHRMGYYAPQEYLNMLIPLGIRDKDTKKELFFTTEADLKTNQFIKGNEGKIKIGLSASAGNKIKNWGADNFAKVADALYSHGGTVLYVIGSDRDRAEVDEMVSKLNSKTQVINLLSKLSIEDLKAFISKLDIFISVDTGPIYIAEAFNVATVDILGPMDENEQPPRSKKNIVIFDTTRIKPELHIMNARVYNQKEAIRQIRVIKPQAVIKEVFKLMTQIK